MTVTSPSKMGMPPSGRRSKTSGLHGPMNSYWFNGTHNAMPHHIGATPTCNYRTGCPTCAATITCGRD